mmetsp:Transcript_42242/g.112950  ORF Transcript_42242/g.112950 Transcript_42242/m.112950 type:complete len:112 (+) Transcript_42242:219-554(+)
MFDAVTKTSLALKVDGFDIPGTPLDPETTQCGFMYPDPSVMMKHDDFISDCNRLCQSFYGVKDKSLCTEDAWESDWDKYAKRCCWGYAHCQVDTVSLVLKHYDTVECVVNL